MSDPEITAFHCTSIGVAGTTQVFVKKLADGTFEARVGIAILGGTNMKAEELEKANPFDESFRDNYATGTGKTQQEALDALVADMKKTSESLWW